MTFQQLLTEAVKYFTINGYSNPHALEIWMGKLREAAEADMPSAIILDRRIQQTLSKIYKKATAPAKIERAHRDIPTFTPNMLPLGLHDELNKRILASADLIKLNRKQAVEKTLQRFSGWATSVPEGGSRVVDKIDVKENISKSLAQLKYEERRLLIDQAHKLSSSIDAVIAEDNDAIAAIWHDRGIDDHSYDARPDHIRRSNKVYAIRKGWAVQEGLINKGAGYTDEMTKPAEEVSCNCNYEYLYSPADLPTEMLTAKGREWLAS
jgi:hypothetical protein